MSIYPIPTEKSTAPPTIQTVCSTGILNLMHPANTQMGNIVRATNANTTNVNVRGFILFPFGV